MIAALRRALASGSGRPIFAATVISRLSLEKRAERFLSCAPFRYMMFLYLLWPAIGTVWFSCAHAELVKRERSPFDKLRASARGNCRVKLALAPSDKSRATHQLPDEHAFPFSASGRLPA